ncbi:MAG: hypothetical protein ACOC4M_00955 [Promethearchaeia archaeon]
MNRETLEAILDISNRDILFRVILNELKKNSEIESCTYYEFETKEGKIPALKFCKSEKVEDISNLKVFVGAQHNEYNGLFGILEFLEKIKKGQINVEEILKNDQHIIFLPLMNPYGFKNPSKDNKSGYFLKNGTNLNRFWRRTFAPECENGENDLDDYPIPEHARCIKSFLSPYWDNQEIIIYLLDFHETSLLRRFPKELSLELNKKSITYKFDHWLKEGIILNVIKLYEIPYYRKPLFYKCNSSADHTHINLSIKQIDTVYEKLLQYISENQGNLPFYFCYSNKSKEYCKKLADKVYKKEKDILWDTYYPAFDHHFHDHGCFVKMSDATSRENVLTMELESEKQFYNIFREFEKSKKNSDYFEGKLDLINKSMKLVNTSIETMISLF